MKKSILKRTLCVVAISATLLGGKIFSSMNSKISGDELLLANVEALSTTGDGPSQGFKGRFNGEDWDTNKHWYNAIGTRWCPSLTECEVTSGVDYILVATSTTKGHQMCCIAGSGNCGKGTTCIPGA